MSLPPGVLAANHVYSMIGASSVTPGNIFNIKYQIFLNDIYAMTHGHILHYFMTSQYLETLDFVTNSAMNRRVRFNEHQARLYLTLIGKNFKQVITFWLKLLCVKIQKHTQQCIMITG